MGLQAIYHLSAMYGRLDPDGWFSTAVTNVSPTAKQAKVLHPTVRLYMF